MKWQAVASGESAPTRLSAGVIDVWWCPRPASGADVGRDVSDAFLRRILARYLGLREAGIPLARGTNGRPWIDLPDAPDFNLSDTTGGRLIALGRGGRVGVDVEHVDRRPAVDRLARRYFARDEADTVQRLPEARARRTFLRLWTAKEAACKATGTGIYGHLAEWEFDPLCVRPRLMRHAAEAGDSTSWRFWRLRPSPRHTAVIAWWGPAMTLRGFCLPEPD